MKYVYVFLISMLPLIELRGAIPYSQALGLPLLESIRINYNRNSWKHFTGANYLPIRKKSTYVGRNQTIYWALFFLVHKKG